MSYQVQQCWRTFSHLTSECFFLNAAEMKERERLAQKEWIGVAPLRQAQVLKLEVGCSVCQKVELWHWALALASLWWASARVAKKNKESWMNFRLKHMTNQAQNDPPTPLSRTKLRTWSRATTNSGSKMARQIGARLHRGCLHAIRKIQKWVSYGLLRTCEVTWTCTDSITPCWLALI